MTDFEKTYQNYNPRQTALDEARALLTAAARAAMADGTLPEAELPAFIVEIPADVKNGDIASNIAMAGSAVVAVLAMRPFTDGAYHPTWGDRKDGRLIRTLSPMNIVAGYIMPTRNDACNSIQTTFEISKVERYIRQKREEQIMAEFLHYYTKDLKPGESRTLEFL